jgi:uncharacterized protein (TIGR02996 family)
MNTLDALIAGIVAEPLEETRWFVLADWLEENDDLRRVASSFAPVGNPPPSFVSDELHRSGAECKRIARLRNLSRVSA